MKNIPHLSICVVFACGLFTTEPARAQQPSTIKLDPPRVHAIHDCSTKSAAFLLYAWGDFQLYVYRACMAEHGQPE